jgi:ketosteroid isomerase-like protein
MVIIMSILNKASLICTLLFAWAFTVCQAQSSDGIIAEYPNEKAEILQTMNEIVESVKAGDIDKLISFHAYTHKFTEFKQGAPRNGPEDNEAFERGVFGSVKEAVKVDTNDMKVAVYYGNVAVVTFHSDFHLQFEDDLVVVNDQISLVFVKNNQGDWKIVHEHHSPLNAG